MNLKVLIVDDTIVYRKIAGDAFAEIPGVEIVGQRFSHLGAWWYPLHGVGAPLSVHGGRSGCSPERVPYAASLLRRL